MKIDFSIKGKMLGKKKIQKPVWHIIWIYAWFHLWDQNTCVLDPPQINLTVNLRFGKVPEAELT